MSRIQTPHPHTRTHPTPPPHPHPNTPPHTPTNTPNTPTHTNHSKTAAATYTPGKGIIVLYKKTNQQMFSSDMIQLRIILLLAWWLLWTVFKLLMQPSMGTLNLPSSRVVKDSTPSRRRILRYINFRIGESLPILFLGMMNLHLIILEAWWILNEREFYYFIIFFIWKWILT